MLLALLLAAASPPADEAAVLAAVEALFAGMRAKSPAQVLVATLPEGLATGTQPDRAGRPAAFHVKWADFAANLGDEDAQLDPRLIDHDVRVDGDIAMLWGRYSFRLNGKPSHCGVDHADLIRVDGRWRVLNLTWSARKDCALD